MIDTIVLYIHNLDQYPTIYEKFYAPSAERNSVTTAMVDKETGELIESTQTAVNIYHDSNRVLPLSHRSSLHLPSSHYSLSYFVNTARNRLEFNFSIPKYLYGTNILQFISLFDQGALYIFNELMSFIAKFIRDQFIQQPLLEDIEINRIDLCYNQFFQCKDDALQYLDKQKELLAKYARSSKNNFRTYDTSLMYITRRYSFKIYHKGEEFTKHDYREIDKLGNPKGYDLKQLQETADCILRYEMTFRSSFMNYIMSHYFFHSKTAALYHEYRTHPVALFFAKLQRYSRDTAFTKRKKTVAEEFNGRSKKFCLKSVFDHTPDLLKLKDAECVTFDATIFQMLYNTFWEKVKQYQLETGASMFKVIDRIDQYNKENDLRNRYRRERVSGLSKSRLIIPALLSQYTNLEALKQFLPKSTLYQLKSDLKKIGMSTNSVNMLIPQPKLDYSDYRIFMSKYIHTWMG